MKISDTRKEEARNNVLLGLASDEDIEILSTIEEEVELGVDEEGLINHLRRRNFSDGYRVLPPTLKNKIRTLLTIALIFNLISIFFMIAAFSWALVAAYIVVMIVLGLAVLSYILVGFEDNYIVFEGYVFNCIAHPMNVISRRKNNKYIIQLINDDDKTISFTYPNKTPYQRGTPVYLYLMKSQEIRNDSKYGPYVDEILAVSFFKNEDIDTDGDVKKYSVSDYID